MITDNYREAEIQALITLAELEFPVDSPNNNSYRSFPENIEEAKTYFRKFREDLSTAFTDLHTRGLVKPHRDFWALTPEGKTAAEQVRKARPPIYYWYREYHTAVENSQAFSEYSRRVFGANLSQHGFSDIAQLQMMLEKVRIHSGSSVLDIGCGNGKIAEYISDNTGARVTGIDYIPEAVEAALKRTASKRDRLHFRVADMENPVRDGEQFDLILSIDSIYFSDTDKLLSAWNKLLKPDGRMAIFYLSMDGSNLSTSLAKTGLLYDTYDLSRENWEHQQHKYRVVSEMKEKFDLEGNLFV